MTAVALRLPLLFLTEPMPRRGSARPVVGYQGRDAVVRKNEAANG